MQQQSDLNDKFNNLTLAEESKDQLGVQAQNNKKQNIFVDTKRVHKGPITGIARSNTDKNLFSTISEDNTMRLWDYRMGSSVKMILLKSKEQVANCLLEDNFMWGACDNQNTDRISIDTDSEINQISMDKHQNIICGSYDSGVNYIFNKSNMNIEYILKSQHNNSCFSNDFILDENNQQFCVTSGFDYKLILWKDDKAIKQTDIQQLHKIYAPNAVSPPVLYSVSSNNASSLLVSTGTGHIYQFNTSELIRSKNIKKKPLKPDFIIDAHSGKVMRSIFCHFDQKKFISISNDKTFGIWNTQTMNNNIQIDYAMPDLIQRVKIPEKPNWIETFSDNIILVGDVSVNLSIYILL